MKHRQEGGVGCHPLWTSWHFAASTPHKRPPILTFKKIKKLAYFQNESSFSQLEHIFGGPNTFYFLQRHFAQTKDLFLFRILNQYDLSCEKPQSGLHIQKIARFNSLSVNRNIVSCLSPLYVHNTQNSKNTTTALITINRVTILRSHQRHAETTPFLSAKTTMTGRIFICCSNSFLCHNW